MSTARGTPFFASVEELRQLSGAPSISYPTKDLNFPRTERFLKTRRSDTPPAFGSAEPDATRFPNNILVDLQELAGDAQFREFLIGYERFPGKPVKTTSTDAEYGVEITTWSYIVAAGWTPPAMNDTTLNLGTGDATHNITGRRRIPTIPSSGTSLTNQGTWETVTGYVIHQEQQDINGSENKRQIVMTTPLPYERYDFPELTFPFPGLYTGWHISPRTYFAVYANSGRAPLWFFGSGVLFVAGRTKSVRAAKLTQFSTAPITTMPPEFSVRTAGPESSYIRQIDANTLHPQVTVLDGSDAAIEYIPESVPAPMSAVTAPANQTLMLAMDTTQYLPRYYLLRPSQTRWRGEIWKREYTIVSEVENMEAKALAATFSAHATSPVNINTFLANGYKNWS